MYNSNSWVIILNKPNYFYQPRRNEITCQWWCVYTLGKVHGLLSSDAEIEVSRVLHLVCVAVHLDPVTDGVTVRTIHHVALVIHALPIVMWAITWTHRTPSLDITIKVLSVLFCSVSLLQAEIWRCLTWTQHWFNSTEVFFFCIFSERLC